MASSTLLPPSKDSGSSSPSGGWSLGTHYAERAMSIIPGHAPQCVRFFFAKHKDADVFYAAVDNPRTAAYGSSPQEALVSLQAKLIDQLRFRPLPDEVGEDRFRELARRMPGELVRCMERDSLPNAQLSLAAEALGDAETSQIVFDALSWALRQESPLVREGAVLGLAAHLPDARAKSMIQWAAEEDASEGVREVSREFLDL